MCILVIWIDRTEAKLFQFTNEKMERKHLHASHHDHHLHAVDGLDKQHKDQTFFHEVASHITDIGRVLILGPGMARHHFQTYLTEHQPSKAKRVVGSETVDHPTDPQIAALARKFFNMETPGVTKE